MLHMNSLWGCFLFVLLAVTGAVQGLQEDYSEYAVYRFTSDNYSTLVRDVIAPLTDDYDVWTRSNNFIDIKLPKEIGEQINDGQVIIDNMNELIQNTLPTSQMMAREQAVFENDYDFFFNEYRDLDTIYMWLDLLERSFPSLVAVEHLGRTFEGRELKALHISGNKPESNPEKKTIVITGGIHAREWISVSTVCWALYQLLNRYGSSKKETKYLDDLDFLVIPVFNPDGYAYTWSHDRLWRKNRQRTHVPQCLGIDIDHSFGFQWEKAHTHACSEEYSGETPFEAWEASAWYKYINETKGDYKIYGYIDMHSYSQEILYPYAYSCDALPRDLENLLELSYGLSKAIRSKSGRNYDVISACKDRGSYIFPGLGAGSALDFMYHHRAHWAFQLKLRDTGNHGFLLPPENIKPVGKETYAALKYFCDFLLDPEI
ncbi:ASB_HP2_G0025040.mRNA.1.CDS.1 [Saccharomyces cerevisiae]|nr:ASB_HP2_G0025040.mRNA.1.CDS.1 [Saccharomyces cerevisiae]CAI6565889.1 ASB_HP1_G0024560.mRNA.1.CDS.1 [Saccharomyces cerevisiae]CAI6568335.1 ASB_HP2_G0025040.mRNA.1.CDS.1 [Saccharomyces cerevisiae]